MPQRRRKIDFHPRVPAMRRHSSGQARVTLSGRTHYLGLYGSLEAAQSYAELVALWKDNGRQPLGAIAETVATLAAKAARIATEHNLAQAAAEKVVDIASRCGVNTAEAVAIARVRHADLIAPAGPTLREALAQYEAHLDASGRYCKRGEQTSERTIIKKALAEFTATHGHTPVERLESAILIGHRDDLEKREKLTRAGINRKVQTIKRALFWLKDRKILGREQWLDLQDVRPLRRGELTAQREQKRKKRAVPFEDVEKVAQCAGRVVGAMLRLQKLTGCRPGEVCRLRWQDIDKTSVMVGNVACWTWIVDGAKAASHHATVYALGPTAQEILEAFPAPGGAFVFTPRLAAKEHKANLRAARQTAETEQMRRRDAAPKRRTYAPCYDGNSYGAALDRAILRAKVERFTAHEIRHSFVTAAARRFGVMAAKVAANHTDVAVTNAYLHDDRADAYRVVVGMEQLEVPAPQPPDQALQKAIGCQTPNSSAVTAQAG